MSFREDTKKARAKLKFSIATNFRNIPSVRITDGLPQKWEKFANTNDEWRESFLSDENRTILYYWLEPNADFVAHSHPHCKETCINLSPHSSLEYLTENDYGVIGYLQSFTVPAKVGHTVKNKSHFRILLMIIWEPPMKNFELDIIKTEN